MTLSQSLRRLHLEREVLVARSDALREEAGRALGTLLREGVAAVRLLRAVTAAQRHPALNVLLSIALLLLRRRLTRSPRWTVLALEPLLAALWRLLGAALRRRRSGATR